MFQQQRRRRRSPIIAASVLALVVALVLGIYLGGHPGWMPSGVRSAFTDEGGSGQFVQGVLDEVKHGFYRKVNVAQLVNTGLSAAVASLDDPYSHYYSPAAYRSFQNYTNPHDRGIGVIVRDKPSSRGLLITSVLPDSPAERAGLAAGQQIVAVGSHSLAGKPTSYDTSLIIGRPGTPVTITVLGGGSRTHVLRLIRANLSVSVASSKLLRYHGVKIGDLPFTQFSQGSGDQLRTQVRKMLGAGAQALILDLRGNGGGLLQEAVNVASIFIPDGTIVSTDGRTQPRQVYVAKGDPLAPHIPLVVLVNGDTASSAEIVTAALQDRGRAKVVGTHTYGKGVYQEIQSLSNGGALEITVGEFFTPSGRNLGGGGDRRGAGVSPNVPVSENTSGRGDRQLASAERTVAAEAH
jgi:carboxyl-terminal processing protease